MQEIESWLAGADQHRAMRGEADCWRVTRVTAAGAKPVGSPGVTLGPAPKRATPPLSQPAARRPLRSWFDRLWARPRPAPYQVCLAMHIAAAERHIGRHAR